MIQSGLWGIWAFPLLVLTYENNIHAELRKISDLNSFKCPLKTLLEWLSNLFSFLFFIAFLFVFYVFFC